MLADGHENKILRLPPYFLEIMSLVCTAQLRRSRSRVIPEPCFQQLHV
jgi:hypothetical protein